MPTCMYCRDRGVEITVADSYGLHHLCKVCYVERRHIPPPRTMTPVEEVIHSAVSQKIRDEQHLAARREQEAMLLQRWDEMFHDVVTS